MRKTLFIILVIVFGIYLGLHVALGSSPVQRWVLGEITKTLLNYGVDLRIESIEFSAFTPKLYLNRVKLSTTSKAILHLENPLSINKIKIRFNPLALIYKRIVIEETLLFHPQVFLPRADILYERVMQLLKKNKQVELEGAGNYSLVIKKIGLVDALFDIKSKEPDFSVRSRSLSVFYEQSTNGQQMISVQSPNFELRRKTFGVDLTKVDVDLDLVKNSIRVNRAIITGQDLSVDIKGSSALPIDFKKAPKTLKLSYDIAVPLRLLNEWPELKLPKFTGQFQSSGTVNVNGGSYQGKGEIQYHDLVLDGYPLGNGNLKYGLDRNEVVISKMVLNAGHGDLISQNIRIQLKERLPIRGEIAINGLPLEGLLEVLKCPESVVQMNIDGSISIEGFLYGPFDLKGELKSKFSNLVILQDANRGSRSDNLIMNFFDGSVDGTLGFSEERFSFDAALSVLGSSGKANGFVSYDNKAEVSAKIDGLSLTELSRISTLKVGGKAAVSAEVKVDGSDAKVAGMLDISDAEIARLSFGNIKGQVYFQNLLLSFEDIEMPSVEPVRGYGFVDFRPSDIHYRFQVEGRRTPVNQIFAIFEKGMLTFPIPKGGETTARVTIEGGHDDRGVEVIASGRARNIAWYDENWNAANFSFSYRTDLIELSRVVLLKQSGALEVRGRFEDKLTSLNFKSFGLQLEDFDHIKGSPVSGRLEGEISVEGDELGLLSSGHGQVQMINTRFRGEPLPDSLIRIKPDKSGVEFIGNVMGEGATGRYVRGHGSRADELQVNFARFDVVPLLSLFLRKDISTIASIQATGDFNVKGDFGEWKTISGSGLVRELDVGLRGTPMKNRDPVSLKMERGNLHITRFNLVGVDGEILGEFQLGEKEVKATLDGKIDLKYLQPFIPALDYGTGKVNTSVRVSGHPSEYKLLGSASLDNGVIRFTGLKDELRSTQMQLSISQDQLTLDSFEANVNGGTLSVGGHVKIGRFSRFSPALSLNANQIQMKITDMLSTQLSGQFEIKGDTTPYMFQGRCALSEGKITSFDMKQVAELEKNSIPVFNFDVKCESKGRFMVDTDVMKAEFGGEVNVLGDSNQIGILGRAEVIKGSLIFRRTRFDLESGSVRFESPVKIQPRFRMAGSAMVREQTSSVPQEYQVNLQVFGLPEDYKIRLNSSPALAESDIISLLVLGVTTQTQEASGGYLKLGTAIVEQMPLQSKLQDQLGVDINLRTQEARNQDMQISGTTGFSGASTDTSVPTVQIQKRITDKTRVSFSNTLSDVPSRELKIEQMLDDNLTVNATAGVGVPGAGATQSDLRQSYGLDFRFRFQFE